MARTRNQQEYDTARTRLLDSGLALIRSQSYAAIGINDILKRCNIPKGSFYHYFASKEEFGLAVLGHYHQQQLVAARELLQDQSKPAYDRLLNFFQGAGDDYRQREYGDGCLMCNLSTELGDSHQKFQQQLQQSWSELTQVIAECLAEVNKTDLNLDHLTDQEAADWLLNTWSGALVRMKAERNCQPLDLFFKSVFKLTGDTKA